MVRLELLRLNTAPALDVERLKDVSALATLDSAGLRALGRLPVPLVRRAGDGGFRSISWDEAIGIAADALRSIDPARAAFYLTSRGLTNEVYYAAQKAARAYGSPHIDNSARLCHAASTVAMKAVARPRCVDVQLQRLDWCRPHRVLRVEHAEQPAGHGEVPPLRQAAGRGDRRCQSAARTRTRTVLDPVGRRERTLRHEARDPLVPCPYRRRPRLSRRCPESARRDKRDRRRFRCDTHRWIPRSPRRRTGGRLERHRDTERHEPVATSSDSPVCSARSRTPSSCGRWDSRSMHTASARSMHS